MTPEHIKEQLLKQLFEKTISQKEFNSIEEKHPDIKDELNAFWHLSQYTSTLEVKEKTGQEDAWDKLSAKIAQKPMLVPQNKTRTLRVVMSLAASLILLLGFYWVFISNSETNVQTASGEQKTIYLPDESKVVLNAESSIAYDSESWNNERKVELKGEAFFEVRKGSTFEVVTSKGSIKVLGTSFNVLERDDVFKVACFSGKVNVKLKNSTKDAILTKGQQTQSIASSLLTDPQIFNEAQTATWRSGMFYFDKSALTQVISELERQYNLKIELSGLDISGRYYTGHFSNKNLNEALELVFAPMNIKYEFKNKNVLILK